MKITCQKTYKGVEENSTQTRIDFQIYGLFSNSDGKAAEAVG